MIGHITGVDVGQIFSSRKELSASGVHPPPMSGIWPTKGEANSEGGIRSYCQEGMMMILITWMKSLIRGKTDRTNLVGDK